MKATTNKYVVLGEQDDDGELVVLSNQEKEIADKYVQKPKPNLLRWLLENGNKACSSSWEAKYGKVKNGNKEALHENEVIADQSELAKFMDANEVSGKGSDCF